MSLWSQVSEVISSQGSAALVSIVEVAGSAPREAGARMVIRSDGSFTGTIGGGALEFQMHAKARAMLADGRVAGERIRQALGPDLGQCCGGQATVLVEVFGPDDLGWINPLAQAEQGGVLETTGRLDSLGRVLRKVASEGDEGPSPGDLDETFGAKPTPLLLFGAGHVGRAVVLALAPLPFAVTWIDSRDDALPSHMPRNIEARQVPDPLATLAGAAEGSLIAVMTHSHALDLAIVAASLRDPRFPYVGLIGSDTKRARFLSQLRASGLPEPALERLKCPIGGRTIADKSPPAIAAQIAVELLAARERYALPR